MAFNFASLYLYQMANWEVWGIGLGAFIGDKSI
jgi:hypothetical protein